MVDASLSSHPLIRDTFQVSAPTDPDADAGDLPSLLPAPTYTFSWRLFLGHLRVSTPLCHPWVNLVSSTSKLLGDALLAGKSNISSPDL